MFLNGLAAITILAILLKRMGPFQTVLSSSHLHDLGKLIFAFSTFWMYLWFSQYMLIWYSNIPEETTYFLARLKGSWTIFTLLNLLFNLAIPFVVLLPVFKKERRIAAESVHYHYDWTLDRFILDDYATIYEK